MSDRPDIFLGLFVVLINDPGLLLANHPDIFFSLLVVLIHDPGFLLVGGLDLVSRRIILVLGRDLTLLLFLREIDVVDFLRRVLVAGFGGLGPGPVVFLEP